MDNIHFAEINIQIEKEKSRHVKYQDLYSNRFEPVSFTDLPILDLNQAMVVR